jgi:hypothetical protein
MSGLLFLTVFVHVLFRLRIIIVPMLVRHHIICIEYLEYKLVYSKWGDVWCINITINDIDIVNTGTYINSYV